MSPIIVRALLAPVLAAFALQLGVTAVAEWRGPGMLGTRGSFEGGALVLRSVVPGSPAQDWGLRAGDRIVAVDGRAVGDIARWIAFRSNLTAGKTVSLEIERDGAKRSIEAEVRARGRWNGPAYASQVLHLAQLLMLVLAAVIAYRKPQDGTALLGAWLLAALAVSTLVPATGSMVVARSLPRPLGAMLWLPYLSSLHMASIYLTFLCRFPRPLFAARWPLWAIWLPAVIALPAVLPYAHAMMVRPSDVPAVPSVFLTLSVWKNLAYAFAGLAALAFGYRRASTVNEKRRIRVVFLAFALGPLSAIPAFLAIYYPPAARLQPIILSLPALIAAYLLAACFPLLFTYAVLKHRLFDLRLILRQGLRYALARRALLAMVPALALIMLADLALHGDRTIGALARDRGWIYLLLAGLAAVAGRFRGKWLEALDRRFFRHRYDARRLLGGVLASARKARSLEQLAARVVACAAAALHPRFAVLLVRQDADGPFRSLAIEPAGTVVPELSSSSRLVGAARRLGRPLRVRGSTADNVSTDLDLSGADAAFADQTHLELVIPAGQGAGGREAVLALGPRRSEEPYGREDEEFLTDLATAVALLIEKPIAQPASARSFACCPRCGRCFDASVTRCSSDDRPLELMAMARLVADRYRLERRLGAGGMGMVFAAQDTALDRRVAVKLIAEHLLGSPSALARFRLEGRVAAGFRHPNLVTVHDFGIEPPRRAFLVMELLDGCNLRHHLEHVGRMQARATLACLSQIVAGLTVLHGKDLIHRDLKPENVYLERRDPTGIVKLLDFGIVKSLDEADEALTREGLPGTLSYMAPERLRLGPSAPSWDLWAMAVMAYEMLTGHYPFEERDRAAWRRDVLAGAFVPITRHLPAAPATLEPCFEGLLAPRVEDRPATVRALLADLKRGLA